MVCSVLQLKQTRSLPEVCDICQKSDTVFDFSFIYYLSITFCGRLVNLQEGWPRAQTSFYWDQTRTLSPDPQLPNGRGGGGAGGRNAPSRLPQFQSSSGYRGYSHTVPIWLCAAQRGRDIGAYDLEWGIHFQRRFLGRGIIFQTHEIIQGKIALKIRFNMFNALTSKLLHHKHKPVAILLFKEYR